ncbi:MAG: PLP-dependent aminotransferase family protein [Sedimentibacter sp.]|uniref:aminotransferase-like domain-containing protein n=1 Tax=Sedimentibacter sp. TaxID=1960295 RepID=UPI003158F563
MSKKQLVMDHILMEIENGKILQGQRLPSCRKLAADLGINKITVNKAYEELEESHLVYSIPCGGFYLIRRHTEPFTSNAIVDFKTVRLEENLIPYREFNHVINTSVDRHHEDLFNYECSSGYLPLRRELKKMFENDGIYAQTEQILVTSGAQQAISLVFQAIFRNCSRKLLVEVPTYGLVLELADRLGIPMVGIPRSKDGYDLRQLGTIFKSGDVEAFYVVPRHQNPTGFTFDESTKRHVADLSQRYGIRIIEDDYLSDLGSKKNALPIHYYDTKKSTIYIRSFSKTFMPGIRIGAAVLPEDLANDIIQLKKLMDINTSQLPQAALQLFIQSGMYDKHNLNIRRSYERKLRIARRIMESLAPPRLYWHVPEHGIFLWLILPPGIAASVLEERLKQKGILINTAADCYLDAYCASEQGSTASDIPSRAVRLCISGVSFDELDAIAVILREILDMSCTSA